MVSNFILVPEEKFYYQDKILTVSFIREDLKLLDCDELEALDIRVFINVRIKVWLLDKSWSFALSNLVFNKKSP